MGKSLELMGLAAFNIFLAMILSATFFSQAGGIRVNALTDENIETFIQNVSKVSSGQAEDMDPYSITDYLMAHISEDGHFKSTINYNVDNSEGDARDLEMDKMNFISHTLESMKAMDRHEVAVQIENIEIARNARSATVTTTNYERGVMPMDDGFGGEQMVPVMGVSYCEQEVVLDKNTIQMAGADCSTHIDFMEGY